MTADPIAALRYERLHAIPEAPDPARAALRDFIATLDQLLTDVDREKRNRQRTYDRAGRP